MRKVAFNLFISFSILLVCVVSRSQAQEVLSVSQKQISDGKNDSIHILYVVSPDTESLSISEASFSTSTSSGSIKKTEINISNPQIMADGNKMIEVTLSYGEGKAILPNYTSVSLKLFPVGAGKTGIPYTINFSVAELVKIFNALRDQRSKDTLDEGIKSRDAIIENLRATLSKFKPTLKWDVIEGFNALRFEAISTRDAQITIRYNCEGDVATDTLRLRANIMGNHTREFQKNVKCTVDVSELNAPAEESQKLAISPLHGITTFSTRAVEKKMSLAVNSAKQVKAISRTKVILPLNVSNVDRIEVDLEKERQQGQPVERITTNPILKNLEACRNKTDEVNGCLEDVTIDVPAMEFGASYRVVVRAYSDDPLGKPVPLPAIGFPSLPERFTKSLLVTFTPKGVKFTALTGDIESLIEVTPLLVSGATESPIFNKAGNPVKAKDPSAEVNVFEWLAELVNSKQLGDNNSPNTPQRQLRFNVKVQAQDGTGRVENRSYLKNSRAKFALWHDAKN